MDNTTQEYQQRMKDIRKIPYRSTLGIIPKELYGKVVSCPICKTDTIVPWLEKLNFPQQPVVPNQGGGHWVPVSIPLQCGSESCKNEFIEKVPILPNENRWALYGDEAGRYISSPSAEHSAEPLNFFCITLVGLHERRHERIRRQIYNLKKSIAPWKDPNTWVHHFTEIWGSSPDSSTFALRDKAAKIAYAKKFAAVIRDARPELVSFNISNCIVAPTDSRERKLHLRTQKEDVFSQSIVTTLKTFREQNKSIDWIFDNIKDTTSGSRAEGWAAECFLGLQYTRLFTWLSAGAAITEGV